MASSKIMIRLPKKVYKIMKKLVSEGYFQSSSDICNVALFEYFMNKGFFELGNESQGTEENTQDD